jgi:hypothetical protein
VDEAEGLSYSRADLLAILGLQFLDLERWPEADDGEQPIKPANFVDAMNSAAKTIYGFGDAMKAVAPKMFGKTLASQRQIDELIKLGIITPEQAASVLAAYAPLPVMHRTPNPNTTGPKRDPFTRRGRGR